MRWPDDLLDFMQGELASWWGMSRVPFARGVGFGWGTLGAPMVWFLYRVNKRRRAYLVLTTQSHLDMPEGIKLRLDRGGGGVIFRSPVSDKVGGDKQGVKEPHLHVILAEPHSRPYYIDLQNHELQLLTRNLRALARSLR